MCYQQDVIKKGVGQQKNLSDENGNHECVNMLEFE